MKCLVLFRTRGVTRWGRWMICGAHDDVQEFPTRAAADAYAENLEKDYHEGDVQLLRVEVPE
jgi:hypothetical protein